MAEVDFLVHVPVSIIVGKSNALDAAARKVKAAIVANSAKNRKTGAFIRSVKIAKVPGRSGRGALVTDRLIYSDDPGAKAIEFGRMAGVGADAHKVPGQYPFTRALASLGRGK